MVGDPQSLGTDGLETDGAYTIIQHNKVHGFLARTCNDWGGAGIHLNSPHDQVLGNWVYQNGPKPCEWVHGIYFEQPYGLAAENIAFQNGGYGIHEWHQSARITAVNNTLFNNGCGGIVVGNEGLPGDGTVAIAIVLALPLQFPWHDCNRLGKMTGSVVVCELLIWVTQL